MDSVKIEVTGNIARVIDKPQRITAGTVGLPVEFIFDSQWEGLDKTAVFHAGHKCKIVERVESESIVPWEILDRHGVWLKVGVYGANKEGSVAIPTIWANVSVINAGAHPDGDPSTDPTLPIYKQLMNDIGNPEDLKTNTKESFVAAANEIFDKVDFANSGIVVSDKKPTATPVLWFNTAPN